MSFPEGAAIFVPADSQLVFQMHYTPNGSVQRDRSYIGFQFADDEEVTRSVDGGAVGNMNFEIPPHSPNHEVVGRLRLRKDLLLTSMTPHMHLRGKSYRYEAEYVDGRREVLLDVPNYDFNWQLEYKLIEPKLLPKGTILRGVAHFDNSEDNIANPDPDSPVRYGDQTWEEMMFGFYTAIPVEERKR